MSALSAYWSTDHNRYLEPFVGSGSLFFFLGPDRAVLGDANPHLIETYEQVRDNLGEVVSELSNLHKGKEEYYRLRSLDANSLAPAQRAARFVYLNRFCFNGLYRTNRAGQFNVPYGGEKSGALPSQKSLEACSRALQVADLVAGDFELVLAGACAGDFVYLDPPYSVKATRVFTEYGASVFRKGDLGRLSWWLERLTQLGVEFLLSYARCEEAEPLLERYSAKTVVVRRNIAGFSGNRRSATEWLVSNRETLGEGSRSVAKTPCSQRTR